MLAWRKHHTRLHSLLQDTNSVRIIRYQPPADRLTNRELMNGRPAGSDKGRIPQVCLPRPLQCSAYREDD